MRRLALALLSLSVLGLCAGTPVLANPAPSKPGCAIPKVCGKIATKTKKKPADPSNAAQPNAAAAMRCRDTRTYRITKCGGRYAEPVPVN